METTLSATARTTGGKGLTHKSRTKGALPAVVYGAGQPATSININPTTLVDVFRKSQNRNTILHLELNGERFPVLVREVQRHPLSREILHVDFYRVKADEPVRVEVPLVATGKAKGVAAGGRVMVLRRSLQIVAPFDKIPSQIEVDATELDIADTIRVSGVIAPEGSKILFDQDYPVVTVAGKLKDRADSEKV